MFYVLFGIGALLFFIVATAILWPIISAALKSVKVAAPAAPQLPMFIDGNGNQFDITPAKPCETTHSCKFVSLPAEECLLTKAEKAVATLTEFAPRAKKISKQVRGTLQQSFDFTATDAPEVAV